MGNAYHADIRRHRGATSSRPAPPEFQLAQGATLPCKLTQDSPGVGLHRRNALRTEQD